ncbi:hypothetical protein CONLIGDRAFT_626540 [Coniochaeta ligniaria NRRL 30616]|uniref:Secreted protein n=1 Tax=Coniochaeta ligniaria NRRL 30616 TaxID=1408157 RepID=A0A1J7J408_9PEZI|nr:hypothetical protein CONLIGDRAFT_626540 [Coniochaeta ligniaria NRRL 30616]
MLLPVSSGTSHVSVLLLACTTTVLEAFHIPRVRRVESLNTKDCVHRLIVSLYPLLAVPSQATGQDGNRKIIAAVHHSSPSPHNLSISTNMVIM